MEKPSEEWSEENGEIPVDETYMVECYTCGTLNVWPMTREDAENLRDSHNMLKGCPKSYIFVREVSGLIRIAVG